MMIVGLTGSIAMGKSVAAGLLRRRRLPVHDADAAVHALIGPGGSAVARVAAEFPGCLRNGAIDRQELGRRVFGDDMALRRLEAILHPLARKASAAFVAAAARRRCRVVVLDVPLLFETGAERRVDAVIVVSAPDWLQRRRALRRTGMTDAKLDAILARQVPDRMKRRRADHVVTSALGVAVTRRALAAALRDVTGRHARRWKPGWR